MIPLLIVGAVVLFAVTGILQHGQRRLNQHGIHALTWRFLTGHPWHGTAITDAGWLRPGRRRLTRTGYAPRFHFRPRWQRTVMRSSGTLAFILIAYGLIVNIALTIDFLLAAIGLLAILGCWRAWLRWQRRKHRRAWVEPVHAIVAPMVGIPVANTPTSWLAIEPDRSKAVFQLPPGTDFSDPKLQEQIVRAASRTLGIEAPEPAVGARRARADADDRAGAAAAGQGAAAPRIRDCAGQGRPGHLVIGLGRDGKPVTISLHGDSPHLGLSMGSGAGKSVTARFLGAQMLYKGADRAHPRRQADLAHVGARAAERRLRPRRRGDARRAAVAAGRGGPAQPGRRRSPPTSRARCNANVGPRIFVIAEELNATMKRLRALLAPGARPRRPGPLPALDALDEVLFTGRQVRVNMLMIGQRLSAEATGGGDARENLAALMFARYQAVHVEDARPDLPMPPPTRHVGRAEVVTDSVRQVQVAFLTGAEAQQLAIAGPRSPGARADMPYRAKPLPETVTQESCPVTGRPGK